MIETFKKEWLTDPKTNILAGIVVALALIPEAIAFSIIAGVDPMVGLYASFIIAVSISILGGRPAMISAATGAIALLVTPLVREYGVEYLLAATLLMGLIQLILGILKIGKLMKFIPKSVMLGFVNALAIMIFMSQIEHIFGISISTYLYVGVTLLIVYVVPRFFTAVPAPLIAIVVLTALYLYMGADVRTVGDLGAIERSLPSFIIPDVPYTLETLRIILPFSISMAIVGLVESLLTAKIVDDATDSYSSKNRESRGQGISNIIAGFFGGMGGCAMIGQSIINVRSGATTRLSTFTAGM
ncbi:SulP family inorganic anion transporter, partial [Salinicoccus roseus]